MGEFSKYKKHTQAPKIQYIGVLDFKKVYGAALGMYSKNAYLMTEKKNIQKGGGSGTEIEIELFGYRNENEYVSFEITVMIHAWDLTDVEVVVDGKKKIMQKGRIIIDFEAEMKTDYQNNFEKTTFLKKVKRLYERKLMANTLYGVYEDKFFYEMYKFHAAMKEALDLYSAYSAF